MSIWGAATLRSFSLRVARDPSPWGRALGYGVLGAWCIGMCIVWAGIALFLLALTPLVILGIPVGMFAVRRMRSVS